ncbi:hypothetical protein DIPPA_08802 [Diplonema papillatum]|nr:hypothetical protein DIPPA_08802 [Diplonema papillatum]
MDEEESTKFLWFRFLPGRYPFGSGDLADRVFRARESCCPPRVCGSDNEKPWKTPFHVTFFNAAVNLFLDLFSAFAVMAKYVLTPETVFAVHNAVWSVILYNWYASDLAANMTWTLVSFAIVFPMTLSITRAFVRRDAALSSLSNIRALMCNILIAHCMWNWVGSGKKYDGRTAPPVTPLDKEDNTIAASHRKDVLALLGRVIDAMRSYLLVPRKGRARHFYTVPGYREARWVTWAEEEGGERATKLILRLHGATEVLKAAGLPANEASRINQYVYFVSREWENLRAVKEYRTPMAMRSFTRVVVHTLPILYAPYFLYLAKGASGEAENIEFACVFAGVMAVFMCGLLMVQTSLEDPFDARSIDTVKVDVEMGRSLRMLHALISDTTHDWRDDSPPIETAGPDDLLSGLQYIPHKRRESVITNRAPDQVYSPLAPAAI